MSIGLPFGDSQMIQTRFVRYKLYTYKYICIVYMCMYVMFDYIPIMAGIYPLYPHPPSLDHILKPGFYIRYTISIIYIYTY